MEAGQPANLSFLDLEAQWTVDVQKFRSKSRNSPFHGKVLTGKPLGIFNNGQLVLNS